MVITDPTADPSNGDQTDYVFKNPLDGDCTAGELRDALRDRYYRHVWHTDIDVTKTTYDVDGLVTTDVDAIVAAKYEVSLKRRISGPSFEIA